MSQFIDDFRAALERVAQGNGDDQAAIADLTARLNDTAGRLAANDAGDAANAELLQEHSTAILELVNKLAVSTPPAEPTEEPVG